MSRSYIKVIGTRPGIYDLRASTGWVTDGSGSGQGFHPGAPPVQVEEYWFFNEHDPASIGEAYAKAVAFKQRHLGCRLQTSVWRRCAGLPDLVEVGEPPRAMLRRVA